ncbi:MAG: SPOR domain-containing protein [Pseudomonadales bacterium]|nr:SPOR domain-containing protein [Pseudomonadales bacterium]
MKLIFAALLAMNTVYFSYYYFYYEFNPEVTAESIQADVDGIYLLREQDEVKLREQRLGDIISNPLVVNGSVSKECLGLGPFLDIFSGENVAEQMTLLGYEVAVRAVDNMGGTNDYRVMIPPARSLQDAFRKLTELKQQGVDSYVITKGDAALGISLGVFSSESGAKKALQSMVKLGYEAEIVVISRVVREFWVFSTQEQDFQPAATVWATLQQNYPHIELRKLQCSES